MGHSTMAPMAWTTCCTRMARTCVSAELECALGVRRTAVSATQTNGAVFVSVLLAKNTTVIAGHEHNYEVQECVSV